MLPKRQGGRFPFFKADWENTISPQSLSVVCSITLTVIVPKAEARIEARVVCFFSFFLGFETIQRCTAKHSSHLIAGSLLSQVTVSETRVTNLLWKCNKLSATWFCFPCYSKFSYFRMFVFIIFKGNVTPKNLCSSSFRDSYCEYILYCALLVQQKNY